MGSGPPCRRHPSADRPLDRGSQRRPDAFGSSFRSRQQRRHRFLTPPIVAVRLGHVRHARNYELFNVLLVVRLVGSPQMSGTVVRIDYEWGSEPARIVQAWASVATISQHSPFRQGNRALAAMTPEQPTQELALN